MNTHNLSSEEIELLKKFYNEVLRSVAVPTTSILHRKCTFTLEDINLLTLTEILSKYNALGVIARFYLNGETNNECLMWFPQDIALSISDILAGKEPKLTSSQLDVSQLNIFSQFISQFLNFFSASFNKVLDKKFNFTSLDLKLSKIQEVLPTLSFNNTSFGVVVVKFNLEGIFEDQFIQILPTLVLKNISELAKGKTILKAEPLKLSNLEKSKVETSDLTKLLTDIPLQLSVELGRTKMLLKDILELGVGSIVELDRMVGEPVDILLNNKKVAEGEVVVIDDNLGVRITQIITPSDRI